MDKLGRRNIQKRDFEVPGGLDIFHRIEGNLTRETRLKCIFERYIVPLVASPSTVDNTKSKLCRIVIRGQVSLIVGFKIHVFRYIGPIFS